MKNETWGMPTKETLIEAVVWSFVAFGIAAITAAVYLAVVS